MSKNDAIDSLAKEQAASTNVVWQRFQVPYEYPVVFCDDVFSADNPVLVDVLCSREPEKLHRVLFFVDDGLLAAEPDLPKRITSWAKANGKRVEMVANPISVPGGEIIKQDLAHIESMQRSVFDHHIDRHSYVIAVGGGAVLDAVGLVAAVSHRGIRHIRIPTTVLAQNDSGVGVKNAINLLGSKNYCGTFAPPFAVINDLGFALRLPSRDKIAGMAEAVKVALIRDRTFFEWLEMNADALSLFELDAMAYMIRRCAELHMRQIAHGGDPFENGSARPLDYGHWSAHKLEGMTSYRLRHGEVVAIGVALDTRYSVLTGLLQTGMEERVVVLLENLGFKLWHPALERRSPSGKLEVLQGIIDFREHLGGELTVTLLEELGKGIEVHAIDQAVVEESIGWLKSRQAD